MGLIVHDSDNCTCDEKSMQKALDAVVGRKMPMMIDKDGKSLFYCDSFGMRGPLPGECDPCNKAYNKAYNKSMEGMYD